MSNIIKSTCVKLNRHNTFKLEFEEASPLNDINIFEEEVEEEQFVIDVDEVKKEADKIISDAKEQAEYETELIKKKAYEEIEQYKLNIIEESRQVGYDKGINEAKKQMDNLIKESELILNNARIEREQIINDIEPKMLELINDICKKIINYELSINKNSMIYLIKSGFDDLKVKKDIKIRVPKEQQAFVEENKESLLEGLDENSYMKIIGDSNLNLGDCIIETPYGNIDCGVDEQLERVKQELILLYSSKG